MVVLPRPKEKIKEYDDLHLHLGGSISQELVRRFAESDNDASAMGALDKGDVLGMFQVVHSLLRTPERIEMATEDVITGSTADYLEIRSTPRKFHALKSYQPYVEAFTTALRRHPAKAKGILSIDRYKHNLAAAKDIISLAPVYSDCIVGIDISGVNPRGTRNIQGQDLITCIRMVLDEPLGLTVHVGEFNNEKDRNDTTTALTAIHHWLQLNYPKKSAGKIRLGHALFLSEEHVTIIRKHKLPIEICPTCHQYHGFWKKGQKHPVMAMYPEQNSPVVLGTDDALNFSTNFEREKQLFLNAFPYNLENTRNFRFRKR